MIGRTSAALVLAAGIAAAQQGAIEDAVRKQAEEVSRLMRESERLLLEITRVDRLVETQKQVEEELKKLIPPEQGAGGAAEEERARQREQLQAKQAAARRQLEEMLAGQKESANLTVQQLEELLKSLPRQPMSGGSEPKPPSQEEREKRLRDKQEDRKQHQPQSPRKPEDEPKPQVSDKNKPPETPAEARLRRVQAWIAKLPADDQERINRNDFSRVPLIYLQLVQEYTAQRAKREAEKESDTER